MKVFIVTGEPFPNGMAATNRIKCYAKAIIAQHIDCEVVIVQKTENALHPKNTLQSGLADNIVPFRYVLGSPINSRNWLIRQFVIRTSFLRMSWFLSKRVNAGDVIFGYLGNNLKLTEYLMQFAHRRGAVYCRDLCELPYFMIGDKHLAQQKRQYMFDNVFPRTDGVVAISDNLVNLVKPYMSDNSCLIKIPILVDFDKYALPDHSDEAKFPFIFHAGTLTEHKDGFVGMLKAFAIASQKLSSEIHFVVAGNLEHSVDKEKILAVIKEYDLSSRVHFLGYLKPDELLKPLSEASLVVLNKVPNEQNLYGFSTKLGEYLAAGKPVIITRVGEAINWLTDKENAYIIDHSDINQLASAIVDAFENPEQRKRLGENARLLCQRSFDYKVYGKALREMFETLTSVQRKNL